MSSRKELANAIRALSMDAVQKAKSGHPGAPMGMADIAEVLWSRILLLTLSLTWFGSTIEIHLRLFQDTEQGLSGLMPLLMHLRNQARRISLMNLIPGMYLKRFRNWLMSLMYLFYLRFMQATRRRYMRL